MTAVCLLDTNILIRLAHSADPGHVATKAAVAELLLAGIQPVVSPQSLFEFWSAATRPAGVNGLGWEPARAAFEIRTIRSRLRVLDETLEVVDLWLEIVGTHRLKGKRIHDAHLLATMQANGVERLLTWNARDFPAVPGIVVLTP